MNSASIVPVHTGWPWLDVVVYVISGGAALRLAYLLPKYIRAQIKFWFGD